MSLVQQRRKSRISLSDIDELARTGQMQLTATEVQLFQRKGILKTSSFPTPPLTTINETAPSKSPTTTHTVSASATAMFASSASLTHDSNAANAIESLSEAAALYTTARRGSSSISSSSSSSTSATSLPSPRMNDQDFIDPRRKRRVMNDPGVLPPQKQLIRPFHFHTFANTTSHLFPDTTSTTSESNGPLSSWRRHSTANAFNASSLSSPTPTVDYNATRRSSTSVIPSVVNTPLGQQTVLYAAASPAHTLYSLPYKMPSVNPPQSSQSPVVSATGLPPRPPPYCPPSPISPVRKRKSIPHRSPSSHDPQDATPGVVFQLPFGQWSPSFMMTKGSSSSREGSLSSSYSSTSSTEIVVRQPSPSLPPAPSPSSTSAATIVMESSSTSSQSIESATRSNDSTNNSSHALSDIAANNSIVQSAVSINVSNVEPSGLGISVDNMPLTPPTTTCPEVAPMEGTPAQSLLSLTSAPWTPVTPSNGFAASAPPQPSDVHEPVLHAVIAASVPSDANARMRDSSSPAATEAAEDPSQLPLKAQRQLSIRRQSLIPRPELDFVNGSGIMPPASQNLNTRGGAHILSYPVLLSDMVQVALGDANARGEMDGHSDEVDSDTAAVNQSHTSKLGHKRKRGVHHGKKRGSISGGGHGPVDADDEDMTMMMEHDGDTYQEHNNHKRRRSSQAIPAGALNGLASIKSSKDLSTLGSPVTLSSSSPKASRTSARGSGKPGRPRKPKMTASSRRTYDQDSYDDEEDRYEEPFEGASQMACNSNGNKPLPQSSVEIPPEEIEVALRHTREMVMHMEAKESSSHGNNGYHPTTLQPLLEATRHLQEQEGGYRGHHQHYNHHQHQQYYTPGTNGRTRHHQPVDDDETEDEMRPVRSNRGQSHHHYPGESDYYDEDDALSHLDDAEDSESAREISPNAHPTAKYASGKNVHGSNSNRAHKASSKSRSNKASAGDGGETASKRKRQNKDTNHGPESGSHIIKKRRPSSTAVSGFSSAAYAQQQKAKIDGRTDPHRATSTTGISKDGSSSKESHGGSGSGRSSKTGEKKTCLACKIQDTPCWRPSYKEGTSLCNSCGLRYKKVGVICLNVECNYIPIKSEYASMEAERIRLGRDSLKCLRCENAVYQPASKKNSAGAAASSNSGPSSSSLVTNY